MRRTAPPVRGPTAVIGRPDEYAKVTQHPFGLLSGRPSRRLDAASPRSRPQYRRPGFRPAPSRSPPAPRRGRLPRTGAKSLQPDDRLAPLGDNLHGLEDEPRLADARRAHEREELRRSFVQDSLHHLAQNRELVATADQSGPVSERDVHTEARASSRLPRQRSAPPSPPPPPARASETRSLARLLGTSARPPRSRSPALPTAASPPYSRHRLDHPLALHRTRSQRDQRLAGMHRDPHLDRRLLLTAQSRISTAARTARSGSSSCVTGAPKTAMTASPMNFSTVPPNRSSSERKRVYTEPGSRAHPQGPEPLRAQSSQPGPRITRSRPCAPRAPARREQEARRSRRRNVRPAPLRVHSARKRT